MKKVVNWVEISTLISTIATLLLVTFTYLQISRYRNSMKADFAHKIKLDFFNANERTIMYLLENDLLEFTFQCNQDSSIMIPYFKLNRSKANLFQNDSINLIPGAQNSYTTYEIEDYILNHFEDLNLYRHNGIMSAEYIYNGFGWYVTATFENKEIQKLLTWLNSGPGINDSYTGFRDLYYFLTGSKIKRQLH